MDTDFQTKMKVFLKLFMAGKSVVKDLLSTSSMIFLNIRI